MPIQAAESCCYTSPVLDPRARDCTVAFEPPPAVSGLVMPQQLDARRASPERQWSRSSSLHAHYQAQPCPRMLPVPQARSRPSPAPLPYLILLLQDSATGSSSSS
ncbi:hypothetical protein BKA80DRAFT_261657 [Phyllosticta citrichinensis]